MNPEFKPDYGISPVTTTSPVSSQASSYQICQPSCLPENRYTEASRRGTTASKFTAIAQLHSFRQLIFKLVTCGAIATLLALSGLAFNNKGLEWELQLRVSSKSNPVEKATKPKRIEKLTEPASIKKVTESK